MYLRNCMLKTTEGDLKKAVSTFVKEGDIIRLRKVRDYAFVHFHNRESAAVAINGMNGK